ncbi:MAG: type II secretion system protein N [Comamonadaceae bacterium]|nr:MAG: type II secretion system protein N [Comamonadaceae bacterium]
MASRPASSARPAAGWRWALLGALLGGLVALSLFAPARWLAAGLATWSQGRLLLVNPRGTIWNGQAGVVFASGAGGADAVSLPGRLGWRLRPRWNGVAAGLDLPCCAASPLGLRLQPEGAGLRIDWQDGGSRWPAAMLAGLGAPWNTLRPEGTLELVTSGLRLHLREQGLAFEGRATLDARDIASSVSTLRPMGSYRVVIEGGPAPTLLLRTSAGSLELNGSGAWNGRGFRFSGEAGAAAGREDALSNLLNIIGRRDGARSIITLG